MNRFIVTEPAKCIGCRTCEMACSLAHATGAIPGASAVLDTRAVASVAPHNFAPRLQVVRTLEVSTPVTCRHCEDAPCAAACPNRAIFTRDDTVQVDQSRCIGCKSCVLACPFGAMKVVTRPVARSIAGLVVADGVDARAEKCDLCSGRAAGPACAQVCPTDALHVMDAASIEATAALRRLRAAQSNVDAVA
jgi:electron transport protein HydN